MHKSAISILEKGDDELSAQGVPIVGSVLLACQGFVFGDIDDDRGPVRDPVHKPFLEHQLQVVPPCHSKGTGGNSMCNMNWRAINDQVAVSRGQAQSFSVNEFSLPPQGNHLLCFDALEDNIVRLLLCMQMWQEVLVARETSVMLEVVHDAQCSIEGVDLEAPFLGANPLPSCMYSLCIQDMVRRHEEARSDEPEQGLVFALAMPQKDRRVCF